MSFLILPHILQSANETTLISYRILETFRNYIYEYANYNFYSIVFDRSQCLVKHAILLKDIVVIP